MIYVLTHYFFPSFSNNHKAKLLHSSTIFILAIFLIAYQIILQLFPVSGVSILGYAADIPPEEVIRLTNEKRAQIGAGSLQNNSSLVAAAKAKGEHMLQNNYWSHTAPDGTEPWKFFTEFGYKYRYAGENLARDFSNPQSAIDAWMASPSHKENMLSTKYKEIGVAVVEGELAGVETTIIVQLFGTRLSDTTPEIPIAQAQPIATVIPTTIPTKVPTRFPTPTGIVGSPTLVPYIALTSPVPTRQLVSGPTQTQASGFNLLISPFKTTKGLSIVTTAILLAVLVIDGIIVTRKKIPRVGGRTFAHMAFLGMIIALLLIAKAGEIL